MQIKKFQNHVLLILSCLCFCFAETHAQTMSPEQCATGVHAILARGQGPGDHLNVMVTIQSLILQLIPGSSSVALPYNHGEDDHRAAASTGAQMMQQYIREYVTSCPKSKIFLMGYSLVRGCSDSSIFQDPLSDHYPSRPLILRTIWPHRPQY